MSESLTVKKPIFSKSGLPILVAAPVLLFSLPILNQLLLGSPVDRQISFLINQFMVIVAGVLFLVCAVAVVGSVVALYFKRVRRAGVRVFLIGLVSMVSFFGGLLTSSFVRTKQFEDLAERSMPLISAISRFEKEHGKPPAKLDELVPAYLKEVPHTGMGAYPDYEYKVSTTEPGPDHLAAAWELSVPCSIGILNWDVFYYLPTEKYPEYDYGGYTEPIKNWAYVHD